MSSYKELLKQREELEKQIQDARKRELAEAISKARTLIDEYGLTAADVFLQPVAVMQGPRQVPKWLLNTEILKRVKPGQGVARLLNGFRTRTAASSKSKKSRYNPQHAGFFMHGF